MQSRCHYIMPLKLATSDRHKRGPWSPLVRATAGRSGRFPNLIQNARRDLRFVLRQEPAVVLRHHIRGVLNGIARLPIGTRAFQNMGCQNVPNVVRTVRQKSFDGPTLVQGL